MYVLFTFHKADYKMWIKVTQYYFRRAKSIDSEIDKIGG